MSEDAGTEALREAAAAGDVVAAQLLELREKNAALEKRIAEKEKKQAEAEAAPPPPTFARRADGGEGGRVEHEPSVAERFNEAMREARFGRTAFFQDRTIRGNE